MAVYAIGDLHLALGTPEKTMEVFGGRWQDYVAKIRRGFEILGDEDLCVICGDLSWAEDLATALPDLEFLHSLPGKKLLVKGNHDFWWTTRAKMERFFRENGFDGFQILHNSSVTYGNVSLCGSRGWFCEEEGGTEHDRKIIAREAGRLKTSLEAAGSERIYVFLHYPPLTLRNRCEEILALLSDYGVAECCYGHLHGKACAAAPGGIHNGTRLRLVSADHLDFIPCRII